MRSAQFPEQTVYEWLDTIIERNSTKLGDLPCRDQSTRFTDAQWTELTATLVAPQSHSGYDDPVWTSAFVRDYFAETLDVEHSLAPMFRVMKRASLAYQTAHAPTKLIPPNNGAGVLNLSKLLTLKATGYRISVIDPKTHVIEAEQKRDWFLVNSCPRLPVSGSRASN